MHESDFGSKVDLLRACISSGLSYINEYEFGPHGVRNWLVLIKMRDSFLIKINKIFFQN
jgi:hypothetical protein